MKHTLTTAAAVTRVSRSTIHRAIKSGKISASKNEEGEYRIDPAELHRVYPPVPEYPKRNDLEQPETSHETSSEMATELLEMVQAKDAELTQIRAELVDTQGRLQEHREAARALIDPETFEAKQNEWEKSLSARQEEIKRAREEAQTLREQSAEREAELEHERKRATMLASRGLIARILNKPVIS